MDALLDMVRTMRLSGGLFLEAEFTAPWCISSKISPEDCAPYTPQPRHIIAYHYITAGRCLLTVGDHQPIAVERGQLLVLPLNDSHTLGSAPGLPSVNAHGLIHRGAEGGLLRIVHGGGGEETRMFCGFLGNDLSHNAFITLLPSFLRIDIAEGASASWIESNFRFAARELAEGRADSPAMIAKLAEILFMEAVRCHFAAQPALSNAVMAGMNDAVVGRALTLIHGEISKNWSTESLADEIGLSRSAFAERFTRAVGEPPMRYMVRQRLQQASAQLKDSTHSVAQIAFQVGYQSEVAFNRAFKREYGVPPAAWRRGNTARKSLSGPE